MDDTVIETRTCRSCSAPFVITEGDRAFYAKVSPTWNGKKEFVPSPTLCLDCRQQRRLAFRNERKLYRRKCDRTGKEVISMYSPDKPFKVYDQKEWWSDGWDAMEYGRGFDFSRTFFEQFGELFHEVPQVALYVAPDMVNSDFCNFGGECKNCYLCINTYRCENTFYSHTICFSAYDIDGYYNTTCHHTYSTQLSDSCTRAFFCLYCKNCIDCWHCMDCTSCQYCIGCVNLVHQEFCIMNQKVTKEVFELVRKRILANDPDILCDIQDFLASSIHVSSHFLSCESCTGGDMQFSKNVRESFDIMYTEDAKFLYLSWYHSHHLYDGINIGDHSQYLYEWAHMHRSHFTSFAMNTDENTWTQYMSECFSCTECFGCIGLRNKQYCILNTQYTKEEYEQLVPQIIARMRETWEWGEFFPASLSPFGYHETMAMEYFPMTREEALAKGFNWSDYEAPAPQVSRTIPAHLLPQKIEDIPDDILNWAIVCEVSGKPFRIIKQELEFYRRHGLPIPRRHPDQRHLDRMALRNPRKLFERKCNKCWVDMQTTYAPDRPEIVYCETCYNREIYG